MKKKIKAPWRRDRTFNYYDYCILILMIFIPVIDETIKDMGGPDAKLPTLNYARN